MDRDTLDARHRIRTLVWAGMLSGVTVFAAVAWGLASGVAGSAWTPTLDPGLGAPLLLFVPVSLAAGMVLRRREPSREGDAEQVLNRYLTASLVAWALQEGGALLGLVVCLLTGQPTWIAGVWMLAAVAMGLTRPRREELDELFRLGR